MGNAVIGPPALSPPTSRRQELSISAPSGVTAPTPVTTTRRSKPSGLQKVGSPATEVLGGEPSPEHAIECAGLSSLLARDHATVIDLSLSRAYATAHISGAWFAIRARLAQALAKIPLRGTLVLTSEDGVLAGLAIEEAGTLTASPVRYLDGGNAAWRAAGSRGFWRRDTIPNAGPVRRNPERSSEWR